MDLFKREWVRQKARQKAEKRLPTPREATCHTAIFLGTTGGFVAGFWLAVQLTT